ncbi:MAG: trypsin-like peptidase domain-containing protein [Akkermansiaceae bacterium]
MKYHLRLWTVFITGGLATFSKAAEVDASKIFSKLEPSVVSISDAEGGGSGVVLTAEGLIITNFHVANTPLPLSVEALVSEGGNTKKKVFENVKVTKVHKTSDLALLKIDAPNVKFKPAQISKSKRDTVAGGDCFAIGYPYLPGQEKPVLTISKGIISSAERNINGVPYIQLDAAINPGNSGGALANTKGIIIGIPTLKFDGADRIGLAAPLAGISMNDFVETSKRKGDLKEATRLASIAMELYHRDAFSLGSNTEAVQVAVFLQREAIALAPNNAHLSLNMARMYMRLGNFPVALAYAESAVEKDPKNFVNRALVATCHDQLKQPKEAITNRLACLSLPTPENQAKMRKQMMLSLASGLAQHGEPVRALYVLSWLRTIGNEEPSADERLILQRIKDVLSPDLISEILAKKEQHSVSDMDSIAKLNPVKIQETTQNPVAPADPNSVKPLAAVPQNYQSKVSLKKGYTAQLADSPPGVTFDPTTGNLRWSPAPFSKANSVEVLILFTNSEGAEEMLVHTISKD